MPLFHYRAYELNFATALELPGVAQLEQAPPWPDVTIRIGDTPQELAGQQANPAYFQSEQLQTLLTIEGVARYLISHGTTITVTPVAAADLDLVRLFLLGSATGALLYQRGLFPLHGSAVATPGGAMVFTGPQGIGKSTLAAHFQRRGYRILSDDVCVITPAAAGPLQVLPAFPRLRLCGDALERLGRTTANLRQARYDGDKFVVPVTAEHCSQPLPLAAIHLLSASEGGDIMIRPFRGFARVDQLLSNLYRPEYLRGLASAPDVYRLGLTIASQARLVEIAHNRDPDRIEALLDRLEREWGH